MVWAVQSPNSVYKPILVRMDKDKIEESLIDRRVVVTVKLPAAFVELMDMIARDNGMTRSELIRRALLFYIYANIDGIPLKFEPTVRYVRID